MKRKITIVARLLLGFTFFASGLTGLLQFAPPPADLPENLMKFTEGLLASGYFMTLLKVTETICGLLLLSGFFVPLALVVLAPIVLNIFFTHLFLAPSGLPLAVVIGVLEVYLAFFADPYKQYIRALFVKKA
jgi:putative oxidoreductase